jgi:hypothetical protein
MEKDRIRKFLGLFNSLADAGALISGGYDDFPKELLQHIQVRIDNSYNEIVKIQSVPRQSELLIDAVDEFEKNLYQYPDSRKQYVSTVIREFSEISPFLYISAKSANADNDDGANNETFSESQLACLNIYQRYCCWIEPEFDYESATLQAKYIISCCKSFDDFFVCLDCKCLNFGIDLMAVQKESGIALYTRYAVHLKSLGYGKKLKDLKNAKQAESQKGKAKRFIRKYPIDKVNRLYDGLVAGEFIPKDSNLDFFLSVFGFGAEPDNNLKLEWNKSDRLCVYFVSELFTDVITDWALATIFGVKNPAQEKKNYLDYNKQKRPRGFEQVDDLLKDAGMK